MTPDSLREWMSIHLFLHAHPVARGEVKEGADGLKALKELGVAGLQERLRLRPGGMGDIFSADYPEWADKEILAAGAAGIEILTCDGPGYPPGLSRLPDPPPLLYMRGQLLPEDADAVAVVGSRDATPYGRRVARELAECFAAAGVTVVSGLARGVDGAAHAGALAAGGRTVAVLGCGMDVVYPKEHAELSGRIARQGALVTEFPLGSPPKAGHFPVRNRILAAMSEGVVVVEAARDSGSLITAGLAAELSVVVGAVPGSILSRTSVGCNDLIFAGAVPVRRVEDILELLPLETRERLENRRSPAGPEPAAEQHIPALSPGGALVFDALSITEPQSAEELARAVPLASGALLGHLLELEILGLALRQPGDLFLRK
jgi:DNA processing protein